MGFTFNAALTTDLDKLRDLLGDVTAPGRWSDEALGVYLAAAGADVLEAGAVALERMAARYAFVPDVQVGGKAMKGSQVHAMLLKQAAELRASAQRGIGNPTPFALGISETDLLDSYDDPDAPRPALGVVGSQAHPRPRYHPLNQERYD